MEKSKLPMLVSSMMVVVITRVRYLTLPPTSDTAPTSEMALPNPINITEKSCKRHSRTINRISAPLPRRSPLVVSNICGARAATVVALSPIMTGVIKKTCAMTMAGIENNSPNCPRGPFRDRSRNTISPATTEGILISVCNTRMSMRFPRKALQPNKEPKHIPIAEDMLVLKTDNVRVVAMMLRSSPSGPKSRLIILKNVCMAF